MRTSSILYGHFAVKQEFVEIGNHEYTNSNPKLNYDRLFGTLKTILIE